jgi:hypothetical protein
LRPCWFTVTRSFPQTKSSRWRASRWGDPFTDKTIAEVTARLKASGKFETIDVRKRYASIEDMSQISLVILANEGAVRIDLLSCRAAKSRWSTGSSGTT